LIFIKIGKDNRGLKKPKEILKRHSKFYRVLVKVKE